ncbi:hypothetical protein [Myroides odoratus]|uniref:hypothetical protein n=1 Tax=Myroides odoratus TaxID=256 RepID=UPI0033426BB7
MAKHIIEENIKTIGGQSIVGEGNIEVTSTVQVDNKTITLNSKGEVQLGVGEEGQIERDHLIIKGEIFTITKEEGREASLSSGFISLQNLDGRMDLVHSGIQLIQNFESGVNVLAIGVNYISSVIEDSSTFLYFPKSEEGIDSTLVVSVNQVLADEKGNVTLPFRDYEYEKFLRSFPIKGAVHKYDREKMGNTFRDLVLPVTNFFDYYFSEIIILFIDENGEQIADMLLPEGIEEKYSSILPPEVDGKSFYISIPN